MLQHTCSCVRTVNNGHCLNHRYQTIAEITVCVEKLWSRDHAPETAWWRCRTQTPRCSRYRWGLLSTWGPWPLNQSWLDETRAVLVEKPSTGRSSCRRQRNAQESRVGQITIQITQQAEERSAHAALTCLQMISSRILLHLPSWSWNYPLGTDRWERWLWARPACGWRLVTVWSGFVWKKSKHKDDVKNHLQWQNQEMRSDKYILKKKKLFSSHYL